LLLKSSSGKIWEPYPFDFCLDGDSESNENVLVDLDECPEIPESMLPGGTEKDNAVDAYERHEYMAHVKVRKT